MVFAYVMEQNVLNALNQVAQNIVKNKAIAGITLSGQNVQRTTVTIGHSKMVFVFAMEPKL
jgi:hypothetical protein